MALKNFYKVCIVGGGNISNTRHIPALLKTGKVNITGLIGASEKHIARTITNHSFKHIIDVNREPDLNNISWLKEIDIAVIGTPPMNHYRMTKLFLEQDIHVLVEKPFTMHPDEAAELVELAKTREKQLAVMHNFQFAGNFIKLEEKIKSGVIGSINSIHEIQFTNKTRRLPSWYNDLPLGLFYDEVPHFIYLLNKIGGKISIKNAFVHKDPIQSNRSPFLMNVNMYAGQIPASMFLNFNSPVCEWIFAVSGSKMLALYDIFRDILVTIPGDGLHLAKDVLTTSLNATVKHWIGSLTNGLKMVTGNLLYGQDVVMNSFLEMVDSKQDNPFINGIQGLENITVIHQILAAVKKAE